jgi:hypothetical protein
MKTDLSSVLEMPASQNFITVVTVVLAPDLKGIISTFLCHALFFSAYPFSFYGFEMSIFPCSSLVAEHSTILLLISYICHEDGGYNISAKYWVLPRLSLNGSKSSLCKDKCHRPDVLTISSKELFSPCSMSSVSFCMLMVP